MSEPWEDFAQTAKPPWEDFAKSGGSVPAPDDSHGIMANIAGGVVEPVLAMGTGMIAKPVSDIAGLARLGMEGLRRSGISSIEQRDPATVQRDVQQALTYAPRTGVGQFVTEWNPLALVGKGMNWLGSQAESLIAPPDTSGPVRNALGSGVHEAVNQLPMLAGVKAPVAAAAAKTGLRGGAEWMMAKAAKPSAQDWLTGKADKAIGTLLDEGINVSRGGVETMRDRVFTLNDEIKKKIAESPAIIEQPELMAKVDTQMTKLLNKFYKQATYTTDIAAIQKAWDEVANHPMLQGDIPVRFAQDIKQGTYRSLGEKAYPGGSTAGATAAEKEIARIMKDEVAKAVPEVRPLNAEESKYLNTLSVIERKAMMEANKNPIGLGWLSTNPLHMAAWMADRSAMFKSLVARMFNVGSKVTPKMDVAGPLIGEATTAQADQDKMK
jgi:hypothetical protein